MRPEELRALDLKPGSKIIVTWFDAAEVRKKFKSPSLQDMEAITEVQTSGIFLYVHEALLCPEIPHLIIYEGRLKDNYHVYTSIPLPLVRNIEVIKRTKRSLKVYPNLYVINIGGSCSKRVMRVKYGC
ncbi:MAG: hypothetical protein NZ920_01205 [Aigarchaeota archaeon]|nr:hypothetical protein [Aigarchaeota archaeon]MDW8093058.1 hypothetical protein [Nitrososphaerota archaeon]